MSSAIETRSLTGQLATWARELEPGDVPARVRELVKSQLLSQLACARAGLEHPLGAKAVRALGSPLATDPKQAACALAGLTGWLSFDDSAYGGHLSHSTVNVPLGYAPSWGADGAQLLMAIAVANECAARVTAAATLSDFRGQGASYTHLAGAVAARMRAEDAPIQCWLDAFGLAFSAPPRTVYRGLLGSDAKVLAASTPVRVGLDACDAAYAGLSGPPDILEHRLGFLDAFATVALPRSITAGLGERWHTDTLSFKVRPGVPGIDAAVDCALELRAELGQLEVDDVDEVVVHCAAYTKLIEGAVAEYLDGPRSPVSALTFCGSYAVATALLRGAVTPADFAPPNVEEADRWELAAKVRLEHDAGMTHRSRMSTAPLGEALREAGAAAAGDWLESIGSQGAAALAAVLEAPRESFAHAEKVTPARVTIRLAGGRTLERAREIPLGAAGAHTREHHRELVREKFAGCGGPSEVADMVEDLEHASARDVARAASRGTRHEPAYLTGSRGAHFHMSTTLVPAATPPAPPDSMTEPESPIGPTRTAADRRRDAMYRFSNAVQRFVNTNFGPVWRLVQMIKPLERIINRLLVNSGVNNLPARPYALSTKQDHTSWDSLLDKTYNARQLPAVPGPPRTSPDARDVLTLFARETFVECPKSTVLFAYVAQWFTDGFLRSDRSIDKPKRDIRRNESSHEVDMAQLYGLTTAITEMLRDRTDRSLLAHQVIDGEEYPPNLFDEHGERVEQFKDLPVIGIDKPGVDKTQLLAMGSDTSNTQIGYAMVNTLFMREHNRIAREIRATNPSWDADRVFAAARCTLTVTLIKLLIEEYINHISPYHFQFRFDPRGFDKQPWMRPNWVAVEFNLLYRWHNLIPPTFRIDGQDLPLEATTMFKTKSLLTGVGLGRLYESASEQPAGRITVRNTAPWFLDRVELPSIEAGREVRLRGFNDYRQQCKFPRATTFEDISSDPEIAGRLRALYRDPDDVEFFVGLFAEDIPTGYIMPPLMNRMLAIHAFSQLMTNPLLAPQVYNAETFSARGMAIVDGTSSLKQVLQRNVKPGSPDYFVSLTRKDYKRGADRYEFDA